MKAGNGKARQPYPGSARGFTLIELLLVIAIAAILLRLAVPSFSKSIHDNQAVAAANSLLASLSLARNTAIQRAGPASSVVICPSDDPTATTPACGTNWAKGWIIYTSASTLPTVAAPSSATLVKISMAPSNIADTSNSANPATTAPSTIAFTSRGVIDSSISIVTGTSDLIVMKPGNCTSGKDKYNTITLVPTGRAYSQSGTCP